MPILMGLTISPLTAGPLAGDVAESSQGSRKLPACGVFPRQQWTWVGPDMLVPFIPREDVERILF